MSTERGKKLYLQLTPHLEKARSLESAMQLGEWDQETFMPEEGIFFRSMVLSNLSETLHKLKTSGPYKRLLLSLIDIPTGELKHADLDPDQVLNLKVLAEDFQKNSKLPVKFVKNLTQLTSESSAVWQKARAHSDYKAFLPYFKKIVKTLQTKAKYLGFNHHPYDALLDLYEPGLTTAVLDGLFANLKLHLIDLLKQIRAKDPKKPVIGLTSSFHHQMHMGKEVMKFVNLRPQLSRLDTSAHPFCTQIGPHDIRLTTRILEEDFTSSLYSVLHEAGHGLYAQGHSHKSIGFPVSESCSLGLDESQSRLYETLLGKSEDFISALCPLIQEALKMPHIDKEALYRRINHVEPHFIRIESDEVSYCLHIILRYEIEKGLIEGSIKPENVPHIWNEKMESYLGIIPERDSQGCLQDCHWSFGSIGYFPTYALGNIYAAAILEAFKKHQPQHRTFNPAFLEDLQKFLQKNIYDYGRALKPLAILEKITHEGLNEKPYLNYLREKFGKLYHLNF